MVDEVNTQEQQEPFAVFERRDAATRRVYEQMTAQ